MRNQAGRRPRGGRRAGRKGGRGAGGGNGRSYLEQPTSKQLGRQVRASTNQKFRPLDKAISGDIRASKQREGEVGDWWQNYNDIVNQGRAETQAAYDQAGATSQAQVGQASSIDNANTAQLQADAAKSATLRGTTASTAPAERGAAAQAQRNYLAAAQGSATAKAGANQFAYLTDQKRIGVGQSIASRKEEQRRGLTFRKDRRDERKERGEYATTKRGELEDKAREQQLQRGAFGLDKSKQAADEREGAADRAISQQNANSSTRSSKASARNAATTAKGAGEGGLTPSQQRAARRENNNAMTAAQTLYNAAGRPSWNQQKWTLFVQRVAMEDGIDYTSAKRAVAKLRRRAEQGEGQASANARHHPGFNP